MGLLSGFDNATGWTLLQKNSAAIEKTYAASGSDANDIAHFKAVAASITTPAALLKDYRALSFVTTAYGLGAEVNQTAILKKLMTQNPTSKSSLAQQLADPAYLKFATAMSNWSPPPFSTKAGIDKVVAGYRESSFESSVGQDNTALQEAAYFSKNAVGVTQLSQLMADKPLLNVLTTALGIPSAFGALDYNQQIAILKPRVDMKQFATAAGVAKFVQKYLAMDQINQGQSSGSSASLAPLFQNSGASGSSGGLTLTAQTLGRKTLNLFA
jgi:Protein of unknown function (DUF1217)